MQTGSIAVGVAMALIWMSWAPPARATQCGGPEDPVIKAAVDGHDTKEFHIVADWALAKAIRRRCPQGRLELSITLGQTVHVWMRSAGNDKALERLIRDKRLPFRHIWKYKVGSRWSIKDRTKVTGDNVSDNDIKGLKLEAENRGFFDWRTYSNKAKLRKGLWRVDIRDRLGDHVPCSGTGAPCEIEFEIR